jgi:hypothetical protein
MHRFVHWTLAWTVCFAVTFVLLTATAFVRGQVNSQWQTLPGAAQGVALGLVVSVVGGAVLAGLDAFFDWLGWDREPAKKPIANPIVRAALLPIVLFGMALLLWSLGVR